MNKKWLQIVNYDQAKRLRKLGFDWKTEKFAYHDREIKVGFNYYSAPSLALALKWFCVEKGIFGYVDYIRGNFMIKTGDTWLVTNRDLDRAIFDDCDLADSALLDRLLDILEQENENS